MLFEPEARKMHARLDTAVSLMVDKGKDGSSCKHSHGVTVRYYGECLYFISESLRHKQERCHLYYSGCGLGGGLIMSPKSEPGPGNALSACCLVGTP